MNNPEEKLARFKNRSAKEPDIVKNALPNSRTQFPANANGEREEDITELTGKFQLKLIVLLSLIPLGIALINNQLLNSLGQSSGLMLFGLHLHVDLPLEVLLIVQVCTMILVIKRLRQ